MKDVVILLKAHFPCELFRIAFVFIESAAFGYHTLGEVRKSSEASKAYFLRVMLIGHQQILKGLHLFLQEELMMDPFFQCKLNLFGKLAIRTIEMSLEIQYVSLSELRTYCL